MANTNLKINDRVTFKDAEGKAGYVGYITAFGTNDTTKVYVNWVKPEPIGEWVNTSRIRKATFWER